MLARKEERGGQNAVIIIIVVIIVIIATALTLFSLSLSLRPCHQRPSLRRFCFREWGCPTAYSIRTYLRIAHYASALTATLALSSPPFVSLAVTHSDRVALLSLGLLSHPNTYTFRAIVRPMNEIHSHQHSHEGCGCNWSKKRRCRPNTWLRKRQKKRKKKHESG